MLICNKCNKEYKGGLKFCPSCGSELIEKTNDTPVNTDVPSVDSQTKVDEIKSEKIIEKKCISCGSIIVDGEKFCIKCGTPVNENAVPVNNTKENHMEVTYNFSHKEKLRSELSCAYQSNKFFEFFWKFGIIFALYYPIYLLMGRIEGLSSLVEILDYISIFAFYAYYISLIALYSKKNYMPILIAFAIRFLNSFVLLFQSDNPISSIGRIAVLVASFVFVFKEFRTTGQYQNIKSSFDTKTCPSCGSLVKSNDAFCPKCGRKMEE